MIDKTRQLLSILFGVVLIMSFAVPSLFWPQKASAAIAVRASTSANTGGLNSNPATLTLTKPAGTVEGDVMIATISITGNPTPANGSWTTIDRTTSSITMTTMTFYRVVGNADPASWAFTWTGGQRAAGGIIAFSGVDNGNVIDGTSGAAHSTNFGTGTTLTASQVTTTSANAVLIASFGTATTGGISTSSGMTEQFDTASSCGALCMPDTDGSADNETFVTAGATGTRTATAGSAAWAAHLVALRPALYNFNQSAYRWFDNKDTVDGAGATSDPVSGSEDKINDIKIDAAGGVMYLAGYEGGTTTGKWRVEKRNLSDGTLVTAFDGDGILTENVASSTDERINALALDASGGFIYLAGYDSAGSGSGKQWRIEKRQTSDGILVTSFNSGGATPGVLTEDANGGGTTADDIINALALDVSGGYLYLGGSQGLTGTNTEFLIEKRNAATAAICSDTTNCPAGIFGTAGAIIEDLSTTKFDAVTAIALDTANSKVYFGGYDGSPGGANSAGWRVERRTTSSGALSSTFGNHDSTNCNNAAGSTFTVYCNDVNGSNTDDRITSLSVDSTYLFMAGNDTTSSGQWRAIRITLSTNTITDPWVTEDVASSTGETINTIFSDGTNVYLGGFDGVSGNQWRLEKRSTANVLDTAFDGDPGTGNGIVTSDPSTNDDRINALAVDTTNNFVYAAGYDSKPSSTDQRWRVERRSTGAGTKQWVLSGLAAQNTFASPKYPVNSVLRLRLLLRNVTASLWSTDAAQSFRLQYAKRVGTCDTGFTGETYNDVTTTGTDVRFYSGNTSGVDATGLPISITGDPTDGANQVDLQSYEIANNFSTSTTIKVSENGLWDFPALDFEAHGRYCFRVVQSDGTTQINGYTNIADITICDRPTTAFRLRHAKHFCDETLQRFYWSGNL